MLDNELDNLLNDAEPSALQENNGGHKRKSLGRGLGALLGNENLTLDETLPAAEESAQIRADQLLKTDQITAGSCQPRREFAVESLQALADSIRTKGVLQPLLVRAKGDHYELIAGERRWRAAKMAGVTEVPVIIKDLTDQEALEVALIENLLRENLSAIEEAEGFQRLMNEFSHTQEALAAVVGKSRSHVANTLRLLNLPDSVKELINQNRLSAGHARCLVGLENAEDLAKRIVDQDMSVREVEALIAKLKQPASPKTAKKKNEDLQSIEQELIKNLGLRLKITPNKQGGGKVVLQYSSVAELDMIVETLQQKRKSESLQAPNTVFKAEAPAPSEKFSIKIVD